MKEELLKELIEAQDVVKDFDTIKHLFSEDRATAAFASLNSTLKKIAVMIMLQDVKDIAHPKNKPIEKPIFGNQGSLVCVRPVGKKYEGKTFLGFLLGEIATGSSITISEDKIQCNWTGHNPAIFVPELGEIIFGYESWWGEIKSEEDFKKITTSDIDNVWYVKLWKALNEKK